MSVAMERYEQPLGLVQNIDDLARLSKQVAESRYYGDMQSAQQAAVKLMIARELGLGVTAISNIHLVDGKIQLGYQILIGLVKRSGKYDMRFRERTEKVVRIEWFERDDDGKMESVGFSKFDMEDAQRADLLKPSRSGKPSNFTKYPIRMLTARAVSDGFSTYAPECAGGALYTDFEISGDEVATPATAPRPIASTRPQMAPTEAAPPETEIVVDAELEEVAPESLPSSAEDDPGQASEQAASSSAPTDALAAVLKGLKPEHRKVVKGRTTLLGIKWDANTPAALVAHFGDDHDGLMAHLAEPQVEVQGEPTADTAEEFQEWVDQQQIDDAATRKQMARAGAFGVKS